MIKKDCSNCGKEIKVNDDRIILCKECGERIKRQESKFNGLVRIERTRCVCDHCNELGPGFIISSEFENQVNDSIQLCIEHANWMSRELTEI